jgi:hypothetical protein
MSIYNELRRELQASSQPSVTAAAVSAKALLCIVEAIERMEPNLARIAAALGTSSAVGVSFHLERIAAMLEHVYFAMGLRAAYTPPAPEGTPDANEGENSPA